MSKVDVLRRYLNNEPEFGEAHLEWKGKHEGIEYKIYLGDLEGYESPYGRWSYYLYIVEGQFPKEVFDSLWMQPEYKRWSENSPIRKTFDYYSSPLASIEMHGGITWYEQYGDVECSDRRIEIGCDYMHSFDQDIRYSLKEVKADAIASIEDLHERYLNLLVRCQYDGNWHPQSEMSKLKQGDLVCAKHKHEYNTTAFEGVL